MGAASGRMTLAGLPLAGLCLAAPAPLWWFGVALIFAGLAWIGAPFHPNAFKNLRRSGRWIAPLGVCLVAALMMPDVLFGDRPVSHDHPVHFFKAWQFEGSLLARGELFGWSNRLFAGYPVNYLYPIGPDLWVTLFYALGAGMLSMSQAYSVAFFGCFAFSGYAVYRLGERVTGSHLIGFVAGALFLTDSGSFRYGGWAYTVEYGVWPQTLSLSFALLAIARLQELLEGRSWRPVALYGLFMGLALLCHPMPLLLFPLVVVLAVGLHMANAMRGETIAQVGPGMGLWRLAIAHIVGAVIAAAWLLPFFSVKSMADRYGVPWLSSYQIASRLMSGDLFEGTAPVLWVATVAGCVMLWRSDALQRRFLPWLMLALLAVGISSIADELHFDAFTDAVSHIQFSRVTILMKPFIFVAAAVAVVGACRWLMPEGEPPTSIEARWRRAVTVGCLALVLAPIGAAFGVHFYTTSLDRELKTLSERGDQEDRDALVSYLNAQPSVGPLERVAFLTSFHEHGAIDIATSLTRPVYKTGFTPCSNYLYKMRSGSPSLLEQLSVRWVVSTKDKAEKVFEEEARFGRYRLYRFTRFDVNPLVVKGSGEVTLVRFDDEEIVVDAGPDAGGFLRLPVSWFPRWTATRDGASVPLEAWAHPADKKRTGFISAPLAPGRTIFRFERSDLDRYAPLLLPLGLLFVLLLALAAGPLRSLGRALDWVGLALDRRLVRWPHFAPWVLGVTCLLVLGAGVGLGAWTPAMDYEGNTEVEIGEVAYDFLEELSDASVSVLAEPEPRQCDWRLDRFVCRPPEWYHVTSRPERIESYSFRRCISAHPLKEGPLEIRFPDVPVGDAIVGYVGVAESGKRGKGRPVDLLIEVGGEKLLKKTSRREARRNWFHRPLDAKHRGVDGVTEVVFTVSAQDPRHRHLCFYAQMIDYP
jgi:hypothetical protein